MGRNSGGVNQGAAGGGFDRHIEEYISGDGMWINNWLRGRDGYDYKLDPGEEAYLKGLDKATTAKTIGKDTTLWRSADAKAIFGNISDMDYEALYSVVGYGDKQKVYVDRANKVLDRAKPGKVITEKGFMSTTKSKSIAEEWGGFSGSSKPIVLKLDVPKKVKGIDLSKHEMNQDEILLQRGLKYKVKKVYGNHGTIYVDAAII